MRGRFILVPVLLLMLTLAVACSTSEADNDAPLPPAIDTETTAGATSSGQVVDCGIEQRTLGRDRNLPSRDCLLQAYSAGKAATWTTILPTIEGDPIEFRVAVASKDNIELRIDNTKDRFADPARRGIKTHQCTALAVDPTAMPPIFKLSGCSDMPPTGETRV